MYLSSDTENVNDPLVGPFCPLHLLEERSVRYVRCAMCVLDRAAEHQQAGRQDSSMSAAAPAAEGGGAQRSPAAGNKAAAAAPKKVARREREVLLLPDREKEPLAACAVVRRGPEARRRQQPPPQRWVGPHASRTVPVCPPQGRRKEGKGKQAGDSFEREGVGDERSDEGGVRLLLLLTMVPSWGQRQQSRASNAGTKDREPIHRRRRRRQ
jgi:hypothetical protein